VSRTGRPARIFGKSGRDARDLRRVAAAILEVGIDRQRRRRGDVAAIVEDLPEADVRVGAAEQVGEAEARRRQRLEAERGQNPCRPRIPRIGDREGARPFVQGPERNGLFSSASACHASVSLQPCIVIPAQAGIQSSHSVASPSRTLRANQTQQNKNYVKLT
jgi:hypothetical protein